ncbi:MAG TPA: GGDEF domain-containing protein [Candidatus Dormibacteraeota bacterium]
MATFLDGSDRPLRQGLPFLALAVVADLCAAIPSGPREIGSFAVGTALLALVCVGFFIPARRLPAYLEPLPSCLYVISAALIIASMGPFQTGMIPIFLAPVMWTALYQRRWHSALVVGLTILAISGVSWWENDSLADVIRRGAFWGASSVVLSVATHALRGRLGRAVAEREELLRQADALSQAAQHLTSLRQPDAVLSEACLLAAEMVSPPGVPSRRAKYFQIEGDQAVSDWEFDEGKNKATSSYPLRENPYLEEVVRTGRPAVGAYDLDAAGPALRENLLRTGTTHGAWIPISPNGTIHGVLTVSARGVAISDDLFARAVSLGQIVELALANALALQTSAREAATDPLTGLSNRRGFEMAVAQVQGRRPFAVLAIDVDGLKQVNDRLGHATGDAVLIAIAESAARVMRRGDLLARIGGDEFASFLVDAGPEGAARAAARILDALAESKVKGVAPSVSIGIACGSPDSELLATLTEADAAMYVAKRQGGQAYVLAASALGAAAARAEASR